MYYYYKINSKIVFSLKVITSFLFIVLGFVAYQLNNDHENYTVLIMVALFCGFFGDVILGLRGLNPHRKNEYFILGLTMFFLGHIIYVLAFYEFAIYDSYLYFFVALIFAFLIILFTKIAKLNFKATKWVNYLYIYISSLLLSITIINVMYNPNDFKIILATAATSFVASDLILSFIYFKKIDQKRLILLKRFNIITYYFAQTLFAISILYI